MHTGRLHRRRPPWIAAASIPVIAGAWALSRVALDRSTVPLAWAGGVWGLALILLAAFWPGRRLRLAALALGSVTLSLGLMEALLALAFPTTRSRYIPKRPPVELRDDTLGYVPRENHHWIHRKVRGGHILFSAELTTGPRGLRISPPSAPGARSSILFFGGSFTFGGAVSDTETLPWQVGRLTGGRYRIHNFAFDGYGPHQTLAAIESGRVAQVVRLPPRLAIYQLLPSHPLRAAGRAFWDPHGPRYVLQRSGEVVRRGNFDTPFWSWQRLTAPIHHALLSSQIYRRWWSREPPPSPAEIELTAAILARSRDLLRQRWPGTGFQVIFWTHKDAVSARIEEALHRRGIPVLEAPDLLPPSRHWSTDYLVPGDGHPNAYCYRKMAESLVHILLDPPGSAGSRGLSAGRPDPGRGGGPGGGGG